MSQLNLKNDKKNETALAYDLPQHYRHARPFELVGIVVARYMDWELGTRLSFGKFANRKEAELAKINFEAQRYAETHVFEIIED